MLRRGEVKIDRAGREWKDNKKLVKVWQYGQLLDTRHVQSRAENRIMANIFVHPPLVPRVAQAENKPRVNGLYKGSHLTLPNGRVWRKVAQPPVDQQQSYEQFAPTYVNNNGNPTFQEIVEQVLAIRGGDQTPEILHLLNPIGNYNVVHENIKGRRTLFYNMYIVINGAYYLPVPDLVRGDREGAFDIPSLDHGRDVDKWARFRGQPQDFPPDEDPPPLATHARIPTEDANHGRRPGFDDSDVEQQLFKKEMPFLNRLNDFDTDTKYVVSS